MVSYLGYRKTKIFRFLLLGVILFSFHIGVSLAEKKDTPPGEDFSGVDFKNSLLKVSVENQKIQKVMEEVSQKSGIKIILNNPADEYITINFDYVPLEKGLKQLLRGTNYVFIYRSGKARRSARLMQVLVFPKPEGVTVVKSVGTPENKADDQARQTAAVKEIKSINQQRLDEVLQDLSQNGVDLREQLQEALEKIQGMDIAEEMVKIEEDILQKLSQDGADPAKEITKALEGIQIQIQSTEKGDYIRNELSP